jgi:leader peptidase (prepilin peptidase)/N-methyltransferase
VTAYALLMLGGMAALSAWLTGEAGRWGLAPGARAGRGVRLATVLAAALLAAAATFRGRPDMGVALAAAVLAGGADLACREIPHRWLAVMAAVGLFEMVTGRVAPVGDVAAAAGIGAFFLAVHLVTREGLGLGDVKLSVAMAFALGWPGALTAMVIGLWAGGLWALGLVVAKRAGAGTSIPLGPFLVLGMAVAALAVTPWSP